MGPIHKKHIPRLKACNGVARLPGLSNVYTWLSVAYAVRRLGSMPRRISRVQHTTPSFRVSPSLRPLSRSHSSAARDPSKDDPARKYRAREERRTAPRRESNFVVRRVRSGRFPFCLFAPFYSYVCTVRTVAEQRPQRRY